MGYIKDDTLRDIEKVKKMLGIADEEYAAFSESELIKKHAQAYEAEQKHKEAIQRMYEKVEYNEDGIRISKKPNKWLALGSYRSKSKRK